MPGEFVSLLGPSGCGKTTTLRMIAGFMPPSTGTIEMDGQQISSPGERRAARAAAHVDDLPELRHLAEHDGGRECRLRPAGAQAQPRAEIDRRVDAILDVVQMRNLKGRYPAELSGGQQQRVALARAIVVEPEVLLLDEPLSNLDANLREEMRFEIRRLHDEFKITTVYVTHDQSEAMVTSDRIVVMNKGRIEQIDAPHVLYARPKSRFVAGFIGRTNFLEGSRQGSDVALRRLLGRRLGPRRRATERAACSIRCARRRSASPTQKPNGGASGRGSRNRRAILPRRILGLSGQAAGRRQAAARFDRPQRGFRDRQPRLAGDRSLGHGTGRIVSLERQSEPMTAGPLARFTVLDLTRVRAGPTAVRYLADWGANCIKVEMPPGAGDMDMGGPRHGPDFQNLHRNKRSITLNLKEPDGLAVFMKLVEKADVVVENYRADVKFRLGIDYESLKKVNPRIILGSISGFGQDGPYAERAGFDQIAQGMGGIMWVTGMPGGGPVRAGIAVADVGAGLHCAIGILTALLGARGLGAGPVDFDARCCRP